ncbi:MAG: stage II sporulation protein M [Okeania sp. SIO3B3]|nr:stage II sporulation protein M [Okeania sp. SIO3B3]
MHVDKFHQTRKQDWQTLTNLLNRGVGRLSPEDIQTMGRLYRAATSDLALAQRDFPNHRVTTYLNQLVARAHAVIYRSEPLAFNRIWGFVTAGFPRVFRETLRFTLIAALIFTIPAVLSAMSTFWLPSTAQWLVPAGAQHLIETVERQELWINMPVEERPYIASFLMQNNIRVSFLAFGSGMTAGIGTVWVMAFNGLLFGSLIGLTSHHGVGFDLGTFVIGHGVIELSVIFMAGGAGLMLGWAILHPGLMRRRDALMLAAQKAVRLTMGAVPLLVIAGLIEAFISPAELIPWQFKWLFGLTTGVILYSYLFLAGRKSNDEPTYTYNNVRALSSK